MLSFARLQRRLLSARPKDQRVFYRRRELVWKDGALVAVIPTTDDVRELTKKELEQIIRIQAPITSSWDNDRSALEHVELLISRLEGSPTPETNGKSAAGGNGVSSTAAAPQKHRPLPKKASVLRQPGAKRRWFSEGNIVAMRQTDVDFILASLHGEPIAFENKDRARRRYGPRRMARHELKSRDLVIARVIRRFRVEVQCSKEFQRLGIEEIMQQQHAWPEMKVLHLPKLCLLKSGAWLPEWRDMNNAHRRISRRRASFNSELLRPVREFADQATARGRRMDEISLLAEDLAAHSFRGGKRRFRSLTREQRQLIARVDGPGCRRALRLLPKPMLRDMEITSVAGLEAEVRDNPMVPQVGKSLWIHVPYERVFEKKSESRFIPLELTRHQAVLSHGREFWLIQETTPQMQSLEKDPMPRIVLPISWEEALDQDGVLAKAV